MMTKTPTIRIARADEAVALAALKLATFRETFIEGFAIPYPPADLALFEARSYAPAAVAAELADSARETWVAAAADGHLIGYAQIGPCKLPHPDADAAAGELYQIYARREVQGTGVGRALLETALARLGETRPGPVWLGVWSGNHRAQAIYAARGFGKVGDYRFPVGTWHDEECIFRRG